MIKRKLQLNSKRTRKRCRLQRQNNMFQMDVKKFYRIFGKKLTQIEKEQKMLGEYLG